MATAREIISNALLFLLKNDPFYAFLLAKFDFVEAEEAKTVRVGMTRTGSMVMEYNPSFVLDTRYLAVPLMLHEIGHILHGHVLVNYSKAVNAKLLNMTDDSVINKHIKEIEDRSLPIEEMIEAILTFNFKKLSGKYVGGSKKWPNDTSEELYKRFAPLFPKVYMYKAGDGDPSNGDSKGDGDIMAGFDKYEKLDNHDKFGAEDIDPEIAEETIKSIVEEAVTKSQGNIPHEIEELVAGILSRKAKVDWKRVLSNMISQSKSTKRYRSIRPNRRYGYPFFGKRTQPQGNASVAIDVSGSVSDKDLNVFLAEVAHIAEVVGNIYVVQGDTEVADVKRYRKIDLSKFVRKADGGTNLQPQIDRAAKVSRFVVVCTDGYAPMPKPPQNTRLYFVFTHQHDEDFEHEVSKFARTVVMDELDGNDTDDE